MTKINLFPEIVGYDIQPALPDPIWPIRPSISLLAAEDHILETADQANALVSSLARLPVGAIAIDTEYRFTSAPIKLRNGRTWYDLASLQPLILSGAAWVPDEDRCIRFLFDLRLVETRPALEQLLRLRVPFVAHNIKAEFQTLWSMGIDPVLHQTGDTYVAARALMLGQANEMVEIRQAAKDTDNIDGTAEAEAKIASSLSLIGQCELYGIVHPYAASKHALQAGFLDHPDGAPFSDLQQQYALADAEATLRLYLAQQQPVIAAGLHSHLHQVELPYAEANARMEFDGVPVSRERLAALREGLASAVAHHEGILQQAGIENPRSTDQVRAYLIARGFKDRLIRRGKITTDDDTLEAIEALDPMIRNIRRHRRYSRLLADPLLSGDLIGQDGRLHPTHRHLGADTGRNTCSAPNIVGISKTFRPVVAAPLDRAILEADYAQIEVGIAAAEYHDDALIGAFNSGDVYAAVAQRFYWEDLTDEERALSASEFKARCPDRRDRVKPLVLGAIYGMTDQGIADRFGTSLPEAQRQRAAFFAQFPALAVAARTQPLDGRLLGYAQIIGGLRRYVPDNSKAANRFVNTPVQGGAGVVFRKAVADLYRNFRGTTAHLILPVHDAVVVECDMDHIDEVRNQLEYTMIGAVRHYYPVLHPRVDICKSDLGCWNKDGKADSIERFLADPEFRV